MDQLNTWWVIEWPDKRIATFTDSEASTAERAAKEHANRMNNIYANRNYDMCCESVYAFRAVVECLEHWSDTLYKKVHCFTFEDPMPCFSVTDTLDKMRELFKQAEKAINSIPTSEDVEKAIKEHKNQ